VRTGYAYGNATIVKCIYTVARIDGTVPKSRVREAEASRRARMMALKHTRARPGGVVDVAILYRTAPGRT
jgi:hypothetical protein